MECCFELDLITPDPAIQTIGDVINYTTPILEAIFGPEMEGGDPESSDLSDSERNSILSHPLGVTK